MESNNFLNTSLYNRVARVTVFWSLMIVADPAAHRCFAIFSASLGN